MCGSKMFGGMDCSILLFIIIVILLCCDRDHTD